MADAQQNKDGDDLSMEEILQSIRKIISDDVPSDDADDAKTTDESKTDAKTDDGDAPMTEETPHTEEAIDAAGSDVLELTDIFDDTPAEEPATEAVDVLQEINDAMGADEEVQMPAPAEVEVTVEPEPEPAPIPQPQPKPAAPQADTGQEEVNRLLSDDAATASAASLKKMIDTHKTTVPGFRSGTTLEDLVLESMKPMLKDWLDANLPSMVERIVEREIRKLVD